MADDTTTQTPAEPVEAFSLEFDLAGASDADLAARSNAVKAEGERLFADQSSDPAALTALAEHATAIQAEFAARAERDAAREAAGGVFAAMEQRTVETAPQAAPEAPAAPETAPTAAAPVSVSQMAVQPPRPVTPAAPVEEAQPRRDKVRLVFSADGAGVLRKNAGEDATSDEIQDAALKLFRQFGSRGGANLKAERALGQMTREREFSLTGDRYADAKVIKDATAQHRIPTMQEWERQVTKANSLTAAAGWCAPSEIRYDLCSLWERDGFIDLPTISAPRGGIQYSRNWSWAQIMDAGLTSFTKLTEAQVIADTPKNCTELPCPTFTERRMDVAVTCITGSFLQDVGYPENVANLIDGLLLKHEVMINADLIAQLVAQAGAAIIIPAQGLDTSAVASFLAGVEVAAIDMRYRERMSFNRVLEVVIPQWIVAQWRADISRRNGYYADPFNAAATAEIARWFATRNLRPQFVRDWQDAQSGLAAGPGDITAPITPITALPTTVNFLIYPAGAVAVMRQDVVNLTNVYDSTNLTQNLYTALFTEEGYAPIFPCGEIRQYTVSACPSGSTAAQVDSDCVA